MGNEWKMYSSLTEDGIFFHTHQSSDYVRLCGAEEVLDVIVEEDPEGEHYGWLDKDENYPCMIWPSEVQFKINESEGKGRHLRLSIKQLEKK